MAPRTACLFSRCIGYRRKRFPTPVIFMLFGEMHLFRVPRTLPNLLESAFSSRYHRYMTSGTKLNSLLTLTIQRFRESSDVIPSSSIPIRCHPVLLHPSDVISIRCPHLQSPFHPQKKTKGFCWTSCELESPCILSFLFIHILVGFASLTKLEGKGTPSPRGSLSDSISALSLSLETPSLRWRCVGNGPAGSKCEVARFRRESFFLGQTIECSHPGGKGQGESKKREK